MDAGPRGHHGGGGRRRDEDPRHPRELRPAREHADGRCCHRDEALDPVGDVLHVVVRGDQSLALGRRGDAVVAQEEPAEEVVVEVPGGLDERRGHHLVVHGAAVRLEIHAGVLPENREHAS